MEGTKTHAYEERDKLIAELDGKGETLDEVVQQQKEREKVDNMTLTKLIELWDAARRTASKASERTLTEGRKRLRYVERHLGNVPVKDIAIQMVEQTYAAIRKETGLSGTSVNQVHTISQNDRAAAAMLGGAVESDSTKELQVNASMTHEDPRTRTFLKLRRRVQGGDTKTGQLIQLVSWPV